MSFSWVSPIQISTSKDWFISSVIVSIETKGVSTVIIKTFDFQIY